MWGFPSCAQSTFYDVVEKFLRVQPEYRDEKVKSKVIPFIREFSDTYIKDNAYMNQLLSQLESTTPDNLVTPELKTSTYYRSLSKEKRRALRSADNHSLKTIARERKVLVNMRERFSAEEYSSRSDALRKKRIDEYNRMSELYEFAGEVELAQFLGSWPLGDRKVSISDISNKLVWNLLNKGQMVPQEKPTYRISERLYPSLEYMGVLKN